MRPPVATPQPAANVVATTPPLIDLNACVVRGQATLVHIPAATQLRLQWKQGLFISTRHMVEVASSGHKPRLRDLVQVSLDRVTVATNESLCLVEQTREKPYQAGLKFQSTRCIFVTRNGEPLIEHVGVEDMEMTKRLLAYSGSNNFYPSTRMVWRVTGADGLLQEFDFDDALSENWFDDQLPQQAVVWSQPLPLDNNQVHLSGPVNFQLKPASSNPAYVNGENIAGFSPDALPSPPAVETHGE